MQWYLSVCEVGGKCYIADISNVVQRLDDVHHFWTLEGSLRPTPFDEGPHVIWDVVRRSLRSITLYDLKNYCGVEIMCWEWCSAGINLYNPSSRGDLVYKPKRQETDFQGKTRESIDVARRSATTRPSSWFMISIGYFVIFFPHRYSLKSQ